jgi:tetratricopeptide (TPR) repeat protein
LSFTHQALAQALRHHRAGELAAAEAEYREILLRAPRHPDVLNMLGAICLQTGREGEAIQLLNRLLEIRPHSCEVHNNVGVVLGTVGRLLEAEASYRRAINLRPGYADAYHNLANTLKKLARLDEAEQVLRDGLRHAPTHPPLHNGLGGLAIDQGGLYAALKHYWRCASLQPKVLRLTATCSSGYCTTRARTASNSSTPTAPGPGATRSHCARIAASTTYTAPPAGPCALATSHRTFANTPWCGSLSRALPTTTRSR